MEMVEPEIMSAVIGDGHPPAVGRALRVEDMVADDAVFCPRRWEGSDVLRLNTERALRVQDANKGLIRRQLSSAEVPLPRLGSENPTDEMRRDARSDHSRINLGRPTSASRASAAFKLFKGMEEIELVLLWYCEACKRSTRGCSIARRTLSTRQLYATRR